MRKFIKKSLYLTVLLSIFLGTLFIWQAKHKRLPILETLKGNHLLGSYHLHSSLSHDSLVSLKKMVTLAKNAKLDFIILTDHQNQLPAPEIIDDLLVLSYAEVSTKYGHAIQLGSKALLSADERFSPHALEHIREHGGLPIIAHPYMTFKKWTGSDELAAGLEIHNMGAGAVNYLKPWGLSLVPLLLIWPFNAPLVWAQFYTRDELSLRRFDEHAPEKPFIALCGNDAHGLIDLKNNIKTWELILTNDLPPAEHQTYQNNPYLYSQYVLREILAGHFYCASGLLGYKPKFTFSAVKGLQILGGAGDSFSLKDVDSLLIEGPRVLNFHNPEDLSPEAEPSSAKIHPKKDYLVELALYRQGELLKKTTIDTFTQHAVYMAYQDLQPGTYRAEVRVYLPDLLFKKRLVPIIYSNRLILHK